jgi:mycothiol system anti-sigma-R factor
MSCGKPHATDCSEVLERVFEYLDGEMGPEDTHRIREHLDECRPCLSEYDIDTVIKALVRRSVGHEHAPDRLRSRILVQLTQVRPGADAQDGVEVTHVRMELGG